MKIWFTSSAYVTAEAKRVKNSVLGGTDISLRLSDIQNALAAAYGWRHYHEMQKAISSGCRPSNAKPFDILSNDEKEDAEERKRYAIQQLIVNKQGGSKRSGILEYAANIFRPKAYSGLGLPSDLVAWIDLVKPRSGPTVVIDGGQNSSLQHACFELAKARGARLIHVSREKYNPLAHAKTAGDASAIFIKAFGDPFSLFQKGILKRVLAVMFRHQSNSFSPAVLCDFFSQSYRAQIGALVTACLQDVSSSVSVEMKVAIDGLRSGNNTGEDIIDFVSTAESIFLKNGHAIPEEITEILSLLDMPEHCAKMIATMMPALRAFEAQCNGTNASLFSDASFESSDVYYARSDNGDLTCLLPELEGLRLRSPDLLARIDVHAVGVDDDVKNAVADIFGNTPASRELHQS